MIYLSIYDHDHKDDAFEQDIYSNFFLEISEKGPF